MRESENNKANAPEIIHTSKLIKNPGSVKISPDSTDQKKH